MLIPKLMSLSTFAAILMGVPQSVLFSATIATLIVTAVRIHQRGGWS